MATKKSELVSIKGANFSTSGRAQRTIKMLQPIHPECQWPRRPHWWTACEEDGHEPYINKMEVEVSVPIYEEDEDGDLVLKETKTKKKVVVEPNITQVPLDPAMNDGKGPELFAKTKGFKHMEEGGFKPLCQMRDCWLEATLLTPYGEYCSKAHARLIGALEEGVALEVLDQRKRAKQLRDVEITP